jgi:putative methyltransferase
MKKKTIVLCNFPRFNKEIWLPILWTQAKTYYEKHGKHVDEWFWHPAYFDVYSAEYTEEIKQKLLEAKPDIFAISLYVWNYQLSHEIAEWVKVQFPKCLIITGGPHQYFKHDINWFKNYPYIDASLPGECYGELAFQEILDNYDNGKVDWKKVTDIRYPKGKTRQIATSPISMARSAKKYFDYNWAASAEQLHELKKYVDYQQKRFPRSHLLAMLETTRGCPYGCSYCDWGGGINTTVVKKDFETVIKDIDALANFHLHLLYICDANFGVFGDRDVNIVKYLVDARMSSGYEFQVLYGGFAKTENKLGYIKQIVELDVTNKLSHGDELKLSLQSIDPEVLRNIDRVNIPLEKQLAVFNPIAVNNRMPLYVEVIMGLPGMNLKKFYHECDVFGSHNLSMMWFHWILMPETPAYARSYQDKFGIKYLTKNNGWQQNEEISKYEVVVETNSYSSTDYLQMLLSTSLYNLFVQGGYYNDTISWITKKYNYGIGSIIRDIYEEYYLQDENCKEFRTQAFKDWDSVLHDQDRPCVFKIGDKIIYGGWYFIALAFLQNKQFTFNLEKWLQKTYHIPNSILKSDREKNIHSGNFGKKNFSIVATNYKKNIDGTTVDSMINLYRLYRHSGNIARGTRKLFGIIPL